MSFLADGTTDVYDEAHPRARKAHRCHACNEAIAVGHTYWRIAIVFDKSATTVKRCERCQAIHVHLRSVMDGREWPDEELKCGHLYEDEWGKCPPEIAALAFVTPDAMQIGPAR